MRWGDARRLADVLSTNLGADVAPIRSRMLRAGAIHDQDFDRTFGPKSVNARSGASVETTYRAASLMARGQIGRAFDLAKAEQGKGPAIVHDAYARALHNAIAGFVDHETSSLRPQKTGRLMDDAAAEGRYRARAAALSPWVSPRDKAGTLGARRKDLFDGGFRDGLRVADALAWGALTQGLPTSQAFAHMANNGAHLLQWSDLLDEPYDGLSYAESLIESAGVPLTIQAYQQMPADQRAALQRDPTFDSSALKMTPAHARRGALVQAVESQVDGSMGSAAAAPSLA